MLETPHVLVGAAIASAIPNPLVSLPLAFASHFVLDRVPHWNPHLNIDLKNLGKVSKKNNILNLIDSPLALMSGTYIASQQLPNVHYFITIMIACFLAVLPDLVKIPHYYFNNKNTYLVKYILWDKSIQADTTPFWGFVTQTLVIIGALLWLY